MDSIEFNDKIINRWSPEALSDKLYVAIRANDTAEIERLRSTGVTLTGHIKQMLKIGGGGTNENFKMYGVDWYSLTTNFTTYSPEFFVSVIRNLRRELGEPLYCTLNALLNINDYYSPEVFKCVLDCFDNRKIPKKQTILNIINKNAVELLEIAADHGWFKLAKKCDEYIEYAHEQNRTECAAWLADYKNRTFDLAKERKKAEKKAERELNAAPDSVTALKQLWNYKKREGENCDGLAITKYKGTQTEIVIPEKIGKNIVTALEVDIYYWGMPKRGFVNTDMRYAITKITLPKGIVSIGDSFFYEFMELREINIPDGVLSIGEWAFHMCKNLKRLTLPDSVKEIGDSAFDYCAQLEEINIPRGITRICADVFGMCGRLKAIDIPDSVQSIKNGAFSGCKSLETVTIPNGVKEICDYTFWECKKLTRVELPDTVVRIGKRAFTGCEALKELVIPEGVREICETAFADCTELEKIVLPDSLEKAKNLTEKGETPKNIFDNSPNVTAVVTPKSYAERYCKRNGIPYVYKKN